MGFEGGAELVHEGDGLLEQAPPVALMSRSCGDAGEVLARRGRTPNHHSLGIGVGVEQLGDILRGVAREVPAVFHPRQGLLHKGLASPVDLPRDRQAWSPEVAVDAVEHGKKNNVPPGVGGGWC